jgi:hypothetical protein
LTATISRILSFSLGFDASARTCGHSSWWELTLPLKRPTRPEENSGPSFSDSGSPSSPGDGGNISRRLRSYLALHRMGFAKPLRYRNAGALLPHLFTLTFPALRNAENQRCVFCCTFRPLRALALPGILPFGVRTFLCSDQLALALQRPRRHPSGDLIITYNCKGSDNCGNRPSANGSVA